MPQVQPQKSQSQVGQDFANLHRDWEEETADKMDSPTEQPLWKLIFESVGSFFSSLADKFLVLIGWREHAKEHVANQLEAKTQQVLSPIAQPMQGEENKGEFQFIPGAWPQTNGSNTDSGLSTKSPETGSTVGQGVLSTIPEAEKNVEQHDDPDVSVDDQVFHALFPELTATPDQISNSRRAVKNFIEWSKQHGNKAGKPKEEWLEGVDVQSFRDVAERLGKVPRERAPAEIKALFNGMFVFNRLYRNREEITAAITKEPSPDVAMRTEASLPPPEILPQAPPVWTPSPPTPKSNDAAALRTYAAMFFPESEAEGLQCFEAFATFTTETLFEKPPSASDFDLIRLLSVMRRLSGSGESFSSLPDDRKGYLILGMERLRIFLGQQPERMFFAGDISGLPEGWQVPAQNAKTLNELTEEEKLAAQVFLGNFKNEVARKQLFKALGLSEERGTEMFAQVSSYLRAKIVGQAWSGDLMAVRGFMHRYGVLSLLGKPTQPALPERIAVAFLPALSDRRQASSHADPLAGIKPIEVEISERTAANLPELRLFVENHLGNLMRRFSKIDAEVSESFLNELKSRFDKAQANDAGVIMVLSETQNTDALIDELRNLSKAIVMAISTDDTLADAPYRLSQLQQFLGLHKTRPRTDDDDLLPTDE